MFRTLIIGAAGKRGQTYIKACLANKKVKLTGLVDTDWNNLERISIKCGVPFFATLQECLTDNVYDLAIVCLPHYLHFEVSMLLLKHGIHVIKEKPLAINAVEAHKLIKEAAARNLKLFIVSQKRYYESYALLKKFMGVIGKIHSYGLTYHLPCNSLNAQNSWRNDKDLCHGGVLLDMGYHMIDLALGLFGSPTNVKSSIIYYHPQSFNQSLEDSVFMILEHGQAMHGNVSLLRYAPHKKELIEIFGEKGSISASKSHFKVYDSTGNLTHDCHQGLSLKNEEATSKMFNNYVDVLSEGEPNDQHLVDHMENLNLILKAYCDKI